MEKLFENVKKAALEEIEKFGSPSFENFDIAQEVGVRLAKEFGANEMIVKLGCALMDIKLGECMVERVPAQHISRGLVYAEKILSENNVDNKTKEILLGCIESHHGGVAYKTLEAEICANADCYRFIHPRGVIASIVNALKIRPTLKDAILFVLDKMEEKHKILSLDICKRELEQYYLTMKKMLTDAINF